MPRRGNVPKREILPDPMYNSVLVTKLVNSIMLDGKKGVAQKVVYGAFDIIKEKTEKEPLEVFTQAMENIMPSLEVKARRVGGATYQVPMEVRPARRCFIKLCRRGDTFRCVPTPRSAAPARYLAGPPRRVGERRRWPDGARRSGAHPPARRRCRTA